MRIKYDPETDILSIVLKDDSIAESEYIESKGIVIDYNEKDEIVGYEIMGWLRFQKLGKELVVEEAR